MDRECMMDYPRCSVSFFPKVRFGAADVVAAAGRTGQAHSFPDLRIKMSGRGDGRALLKYGVRRRENPKIECQVSRVEADEQ